jgi:hypothetical protein
MSTIQKRLYIRKAFSEVQFGLCIPNYQSTFMQKKAETQAGAY